MPLFILFLSLWLAGFSTNVFATDITVSLDRSPVSVDESFQIIFTASESPNADPDFSPLEQDFTIQNQSENSRFEFVNGKSNRIIQWILTVMANDSGNLIIPVIKFGTDSSPALKIVVSPSSTANKNAAHDDDDLYLEVTTNTAKPFIQSQVLYTVKLYRRVDLAKANMSEPELNDAVIEKLADDTNYTTQLSGVTYVVIERKYAIFPQKSGTITIKPLVLTADIVARGRQNNSFFNSQTTQRRIVKSNVVTLNVQPIPATFTDSHWLVAEQIELTQTWSGDTTQMKVGEPLTRTVKLVVHGSTAGQIPDTTPEKIDPQLKSYNDQPVLHEEKTLAGITASREEKIAFIPTKSGNYKLPAIQIFWFNTQSQKIEKTILPEINLTVSAAENVQTVESISPQTESNNTATAEVTTIFEIEKRDFLWQFVAIFSTIGWLITLGFWFLKTKATAKNVSETLESPAEISLKSSVTKLKNACMADNSDLAKTVLLEWGKLQFNATSLGAIAPHCEARLRDQILKLNATLYAKNPEIWQGKELFKTFSENNVRAKLATREKPEVLKPLYRL
ncbi:MAG: protein BatD [Methylococcaceae bacterium]|nr:protein BatD [Methylococcaceae bacterium]